MTKPAIDKGVPLTPSLVGSPAGKRHNRYPWTEMAVGDSFFVEEAKPTNRLFAAASYAQRVGDRQFTCRRVDGGVRVWRVA